MNEGEVMTRFHAGSSEESKMRMSMREALAVLWTWLRRVLWINGSVKQR